MRGCHGIAAPRTALVVTVGLVTLFFVLVAYFLGPDLIKQRDENVGWYFLHITGGALVLALGPFQFIAPIRNRFRRYHRAAGCIYILASLMAFAGIIGLLPLKFDLFFPSQLVALTLSGATMPSPARARVIPFSSGDWLRRLNADTRQPPLIQVTQGTRPSPCSVIPKSWWISRIAPFTK